MTLQASWQADADPMRKRHYQAKYAALIEPLVAGKGDDLSMLLAGRAANAHRELGQFQAAAALLDTLPLASLMVVIPPEQLDGDRVTNSAEVGSARARRDLFAYLTGLKDLVATRNAAAEPPVLMPRPIAADRCRDGDVLSDDDRGLLCRGRRKERRPQAAIGPRRDYFVPAFCAFIHASSLASSTVIGSAPVSRTCAWKARGSNFAPSSALAFAFSLRMVSAPIL